MWILSLLVFVAMVLVAAWGWMRIPDERRFPIRLGVPPSLDATLGKRTALTLWVVVGGVVLVGSLVGDREEEVRVLGLLLLTFLLAMEFVAIRRLAR